MYWLRTMSTLTVIVVLSGCRGREKEQPAVLPPPEVIVSQVVSRQVTDISEFTGDTSAVESVDVRARVNGYLDEIHFTDGQEVKQGDLLFRIDPRPFKAELEHAQGQKAQWEARQARAQADMQRYEKLVPTGAATPQDLDKAKADKGEAAAGIQSSEAMINQAQLNLEFSHITAPIAGQISRTLLTKGNLIRADVDLLTTIVRLDPIYVYFNVDERTMLQVQQRIRTEREQTLGPPGATLPDIRALKVPLYIGLANEEGYPHQGMIDFIDNQVDPSTGSIRVRGVFDNSARVFKPGLFVRVRVPIGNPFEALLVSDRAIGTDQNQKFVYVVDDKNVAQYRAVQLGRLEDDGLRVITAGLQPGDWVIVTGIQRARPGKAVTPQRQPMPTLSPRTESPSIVIQTQLAPH